MAFTSIDFFCFLLISLVVYYICPKKLQWVVLLAASLVFYCMSGVVPALFVLLTSATVWLGALVMERMSQRTKAYISANKSSLSAEQRKSLKAKTKVGRRAVFLAVLLLNLGILCVLKYYNFIGEYAMRLTGLISGQALEFSAVDFIVPLGISFYTFQAVGYLMDIYGGKYAAEKNPARFLLFVSFFPQVIQGPIARYDRLSGQLKAEHRFNITQIKHGVILMLWGFFMKLVIADRMAPLVASVFAEPRLYGGCVTVIAVFFYAVQLYADFAGGINIVTGAAQMFGIELELNFKRPYFATSLGDFWRRWHISLGAWMRDYLFYPLATSKAIGGLSKALKKRAPSLARTIPAAIGNLVVFFVVGIWHGAQWCFIFWGLYNGVALALSAVMEPAFKAWNERFPRLRDNGAWRVFQILRTFFIVCVGYYFDRAASVKDALYMLINTVNAPLFGQLTDGTLTSIGIILYDYAVLAAALALLFAVSLAQERGVKLREWIDTKPIAVRWGVVYALFIAVVLFAYININETESFLYAAF